VEAEAEAAEAAAAHFLSLSPTFPCPQQSSSSDKELGESYYLGQQVNIQGSHWS
jgi:hypothetical protein